MNYYNLICTLPKIVFNSSVSAGGVPVGQHHPPLHAAVGLLLVSRRRIPDLPLARRRLPIGRIQDDQVGAVVLAHLAAARPVMQAVAQAVAQDLAEVNWKLRLSSSLNNFEM